jgi:hypothetical protein
VVFGMVTIHRHARRIGNRPFHGAIGKDVASEEGLVGSVSVSPSSCSPLRWYGSSWSGRTFRTALCCIRSPAQGVVARPPRPDSLARDLRDATTPVTHAMTRPSRSGHCGCWSIVGLSALERPPMWSHA